MKQKFTLATVLVFFTLCSLGQKKEMMQNNFRGADRQKTLTDLHFQLGINPEKHEDRLSSFLKFIAKVRKPSFNKSNQQLLQRLDSLVEQTINNEPEYKEIYSYDDNRNMTQVIDYGRDINTNAWFAWSKYNITYNSSGNFTQSFAYEWDSNAASWVAKDKMDFTYDSGGNLTQEIIYHWDSNTNDWIARFTFDCIYDSSWNMTQLISNGWDSNTNSWIAYSKSDHTFDATGNMTQRIVSDWDKNTNVWIAYFKADYSYDATGNMIQGIEYNWDNNTNVWFAYYRADYSYDTNGNPTLESYYFWDETTSQYIPSIKFDYTYDLSYNLSNLILPPLGWLMPDYNTEITNMPLAYSFSDWDEQSSSWVKKNTGVYYYSEVNTNSVTETKDNGNKIYPNPVSEYINVSGITGMATFELYNAQGVLVLNKTLIADECIDVSNLNNGVYFYTLTIEQKKQTGKIIKK
jgi:hypothetical protein